MMILVTGSKIKSVNQVGAGKVLLLEMWRAIGSLALSAQNVQRTVAVVAWKSLA
jgi:hypothetical protein